MEAINTLIKKYQRFIDNETAYLNCPVGLKLPEDDRQLFIQRILDWEGFVADLKMINCD